MLCEWFINKRNSCTLIKGWNGISFKSIVWQFINIIVPQWQFLRPFKYFRRAYYNHLLLLLPPPPPLRINCLTAVNQYFVNHHALSTLINYIDRSLYWSYCSDRERVMYFIIIYLCCIVVSTHKCYLKNILTRWFFMHAHPFCMIKLYILNSDYDFWNFLTHSKIIHFRILDI